MDQLRLFIDTHDSKNGTFSVGMTPEMLRSFFQKYDEACRIEGVIPVRLFVGYEQARGFCLTMALDADAVRRAHERVGLPFDSITEVATASRFDTFAQLSEQVA